MPVLLSPSTTRLRRCMAVALLAALVLAQTLGWMHRSTHWGAAGSMPHAVAASASHADPAVAGSGWMADLFGSHADTSDCRLFDVLGQAGCTPPALGLPAVVPGTALIVATQGDFVARWATLFDARGPPPSR